MHACHWTKPSRWGEAMRRERLAASLAQWHRRTRPSLVVHPHACYLRRLLPMYHVCIPSTMYTSGHAWPHVIPQDIYDRAPDLSWSKGRVCLLGDAAHPMMPNLGQGGGMAIEDALVLSQEIAKLNEGNDPNGIPCKRLPLALRRYNQNRVLRAAAVQGLSRVSSAFLFQYQASPPAPPSLP